MRRFLKITEIAIHRLTGLASYICMGLLFIMMILTFSDVAGRYLFNYPIPGTIEYIEIMMMMCIFLSLAYVTYQKSHVVIDLLTRYLPLAMAPIINCITTFLSLVIITLITWQMFERAIDTLIHPGLVTITLSLPTGPLFLIAAIGSLLLWLEQILVFRTSLSAIVGKARS